MKHYFGFVLFPGGTISLFLAVTSLATADWVNSGTVSMTSFGLWQECVDYTCFTLTDVPSYLNAVRAFLITSCVTSVASAILSLAISVGSKPRTAVDASMMLTYLASTILLATGMVVYTVEQPLPYPTRYGYSFVLGWLAVALCFVCSTVGIFAVIKSR
uniref:lens fiber membrane intrinsic protein-like n=1 Tax=Ciona intestinalis TaxID=7719 RepID=UPI00006A55A3|nr:lens fiber membrane intrinsic protein-like [Ciona intestinalis]|eukprot:XP_002125056.1 lens fiber membrane intrinsic protein-like [Ciona intestinalis]